MENNCQIVLKSRPGVNGEPADENFSCEECDYPSELQDNDVLVKMLYLSIDPALRCCMNEETGVDYIDSWKIGEAVIGLSGLGQVIQTKNSNFPTSSLVVVNMMSPWKKYINFKQGAHLTKIDKPMEEILVSSNQPYLAISVLGITGLTAYLGVIKKGHISKGSNQTMVVSGAAGATGSVAGQVGKLEGCSRLIGICGTDEKCNVLTGELGFDEAINYRTEDVGGRLKQLCPDGIDVYFDNVGGQLSDQVIKQMKDNSHVILCGQIAVYNTDAPYPPPISPEITEILQKRNITRERFLVLNYMEEFEKSVKQLSQWLQEGLIVSKETIEEGIENAGRAFVSMMKGGNVGKQLVHVSDITS